MLVRLSLAKKMKVRHPYMCSHPRNTPLLEEWTKEVEMYMAYDEQYVYFETEEDRLQFQFTWTFPPYGPKGTQQ